MPKLIIDRGTESSTRIGSTCFMTRGSWNKDYLKYVLRICTANIQLSVYLGHLGRFGANERCDNSKNSKRQY